MCLQPAFSGSFNCRHKLLIIYASIKVNRICNNIPLDPIIGILLINVLTGMNIFTRLAKNNMDDMNLPFTIRQPLALGQVSGSFFAMRLINPFANRNISVNME
jgi:hypothetical protein